MCQQNFAQLFLFSLYVGDWCDWRCVVSNPSAAGYDEGGVSRRPHPTSLSSFRLRSEDLFKACLPENTRPTASSASLWGTDNPKASISTTSRRASKFREALCSTSTALSNTLLSGGIPLALKHGRTEVQMCLNIPVLPDASAAHALRYFVIVVDDNFHPFRKTLSMQFDAMTNTASWDACSP